MKRLCISIVVLFLFSIAKAQNIGIGITTPRAKLHIFQGASGYSGIPYPPLVVENNGHTYVNLLSPDANERGVLFGNSTDAAHGGIIYNNGATQNGLQFRTNGNQTRMVITSDGNVGIGQLEPVVTLEVGRGSSYVGTAIFHGATHASQFNYSFFEDTYIRAGKDNGRVILNDIPGGRVGIGTSSPNAPLGFPNTLGKKITLYPGGSGDAGFGVQTGVLQIYAQNSGDIAFGFDQSSGFFERFRMRANGAFVVNGNSGSAGQVLKSNGDAAPNWVNPTNQLYNNTIIIRTSGSVVLNSGSSVALPGLTHSFTTTSNTKVLITFSIQSNSPSCFACGPSGVFIDINLNGNLSERFHEDIPNGNDISFGGTHLIVVGPGTHTISFSAFRSGTDATVGHSLNASHAILQIISF